MQFVFSCKQLYTEIGIYNCLSSPGKGYVILGGQHILKALERIRLERPAVKGTTEEDLPECLRSCLMTVLVETAPLNLRAWAAGQHQRRQKLSTSSSTGDFFAVALEEARAKLVRLKTVWMSDNDMWYLLERSGMAVESVKSSMKDKEKAVSSKEVSKEHLSVVCHTRSSVYIVSSYSFFSGPTPSTTGGSSSTLPPAWCCTGTGASRTS